MVAKSPPRRGHSSRSTSASPAERTKPFRVTVDLDPADYNALRDWAHFARMSHSDVLRALLRLLATDETIAAAVRDA
jgi:hypothetical protein